MAKLDEIEWAVDCLRSRMDSVERADAIGYSAAELKKLVNGVDYAMTSLKQAGTGPEAARDATADASCACTARFAVRSRAATNAAMGREGSADQ